MPSVRREDLEAREGVDFARRARLGFGAIVYTLLVVAALALVLGVAIHFRKTWDFSRQGQNSLSQKTLDALASLDQPVSVHGLLKDSDRRREGYWDLLQLYRRASDKVRVEVFDPNARPAALASLGLSAEDRNAIKDGVSVAVAGARKVAFRGMAEEDVTNAILEAGSTAPRVVGFVRGYGERDPGSTADAGMSRARDALKAEYYDVADVRLDVPIPPDVTTLIVAGPQAAAPRADLDRLAAWLEAGGRLLLLVDPQYDAGFGEVASRWGVRAKDLRVLDRRDNLRGQPEIPLAKDFSKHPIVRGFGAGMPLALPLPAAVEDFEPGDPAVFHEALVQSSAFAEGLTPAGSREQGPFALAAASYKAIEASGRREAETRVVLVGNAAFATNGFLAESSNRNFFLNCVGWLSRSRGLVTIRRQPLQGQTLTISRGEFRIFEALVVLPPALVVVFGLIVFYRRRGL